MRQPKFIPILMSTPMVIANLNDSKNQTRRTKGLEKLKDCTPDHKHTSKDCSWRNKAIKMIQDVKNKIDWFCEYCGNGHGVIKCPYGKVGDILWVRETTCYVMLDHAHDLLEGAGSNSQTVYKASVHSDWMEYAKEKYGYKWTPSLFMPKSACRLFLEVIEVRVERLNDISEQDAIDEGIIPLRMSRMQLAGSGQLYLDYSKKAELFNEGVGPLQSYKSLWESINGKGSWADNPWVWCVRYKRIDKPINFL